MSLADQKYLLNSQYKNASNLNARIQIHKRFSTNPYGWFPWVLDHLQLPERGRILELGCGGGGMWAENPARIPDGCELTLSDFSSGMLEEARKNLAQVGRPLRFEIIDAQSIPFADGYFDAVIANHMLYHVPDRQKALSEIRRALKPGGPFYATTIGNRHLKELADLVNRFFGSDWVYWGNNFLAEEFSLENGREQIAVCFETVAVLRYDDALEVTDAGLLVDYVYSSNKTAANEDRRPAFLVFVEQEIATHGAIHITKDSGLFIAS